MGPRIKEDEGSPQSSSLPGLKFPSYRKEIIRSPDAWLEGKKQDDDTGGLWRVHDDLYDFSQWIYKHPGGADWLSLTKGTDITEAFEAHHVARTAEILLKQFHVRPATTPRNSPYTFHENGFYRTLKRKAREILKDVKPGPSSQSKMCADLLLASSLIMATLAAAKGSYLIGAVAALLLSFTCTSGHNFFHMRDNFRMYYFDLSFMPSRDWRVSHALSHHLYTNTLLDLEISMFEPLLQWLPTKTKSLWVRYVSWLYSPIVYMLTFYVHPVLRIVQAIRGTTPLNLRKEDFIPFLPLLVMYTYSGATFKETFYMWLWIELIASFFFIANGVNAAHHHPEIFHDGDAPREDRDWGLGQIDAVRDRMEICQSVFLVLVTFGDHCLHHMFPTVDHWNLNRLYPMFYQTCKEFGIDYKMGTVLDLLRGQFIQLANTNPNTEPPRANPKL